MRPVLTAVVLILLAIAAYLAIDRFARDPGGVADPTGLNDSSDTNQPSGSDQPARSPESRKDEIVEAMANSDSYPFEFSLVSTDGQTVSSEDFAGRVLIVDFWGTWCPPCRQEIPHFVELQDDYRDQGLSIVGINYENAPTRQALAAIADFTAEVPVNYPLLLGDDETRQQVPNFRGFPTTLFIDGAGQVRLTWLGARPKADLEAAVQVLLEEQGPPETPDAPEEETASVPPAAPEASTPPDDQTPPEN